jgi:hypothetical protein
MFLSNKHGVNVLAVMTEPQDEWLAVIAFKPSRRVAGHNSFQVFKIVLEMDKGGSL